MSDLAAPSVGGSGWKATVQKVGGNLAAMVMPNIGAFLAWGLLTALFIPTGWIPNEGLANMVGPMIVTLLPVLIGYTGGRLVHDQRGAVIGAVATMGVVVGSEIPQFLGAMLIGPAAAYVLKQLDKVLVPKVKAGFEMLYNNFSLGIVGVATAVAGYVAIGPIVENITTALGNGVDFLVSNSVLPLVSIIVEPAKVLFLNNAINHGVLSPIGVVESESLGQSIMFMIETNPGPGLGVLIAFWLAGPRLIKNSTPAAMIIHFFGGIHEVYFPYILMKPRMILAAIAGGMAGVATFMVTGAGLLATPSPGSIFAYLAVTPRGGFFGPLLGIAISTVVAAAVGVVLLKMDKTIKIEDDAFEAAQAESASNKNLNASAEA